MNYYIKERFDSQSGAYYIACGQMSVKAAKVCKGTLYSSSYMAKYETKDKYNNRIKELRDNGARIQYMIKEEDPSMVCEICGKPAKGMTDEFFVLCNRCKAKEDQKQEHEEECHFGEFDDCEICYNKLKREKENIMELAKVTMGREEREAILTSRLADAVKKGNGEILRFDCGLKHAIFGRWFDENPYFWVEKDDLNTYIVKGKRFFNVSGGEVRVPSKGESNNATKEDKKEEKTMKTTEKAVAPKTTTKVEAPKAVTKTVVIPKGGEMVKQLGYKGEEELLSAVLYCNKVVCACGNVRWVKNSDVFQVKKCKPCMKAKRLKNISKMKEKSAGKKPVAKVSNEVKTMMKVKDGVAPSKLAEKKTAEKKTAVEAKKASKKK
jgi:hypothetical protein